MQVKPKTLLVEIYKGSSHIKQLFDFNTYTCVLRNAWINNAILILTRINHNTRFIIIKLQAKLRKWTFYLSWYLTRGKHQSVYAIIANIHRVRHISCSRNSPWCSLPDARLPDMCYSRSQQQTHCGRELSDHLSQSERCPCSI